MKTTAEIPSLPEAAAAASPESRAQRFLRIRAQTEAICAPLQTEDYVVQPVVDVSPPKWHLGHSTWFFEQFFLAAFVPGYQRFHEAYAFVFNSYYETLGKRVLRTDRGNLTRPSVADIYRYRAHVNEHMAQFLSAQAQLPAEAEKVLEIGLQHEQQHQELLVTDIKYILGHNPLFPAWQPEIKPPFPAHAAAAAASQEWLDMPEGLYQTGHTDTGFCFDNQLGVHRVFVPAFRLRARLVTVAEYQDFMDAGGYSDFRHWLAEGWDWVQTHQVEAPLYWHRQDGLWQHYTPARPAAPDPAAPVTHLSFFEADAFARWKGLRLPTEFEWEAACRHYAPNRPASAHFSDAGLYQPQPATGPDLQLWGSVWEWTNSAYLPYPYYRKDEGALGEYNGKFMINQMVLRGGSCATPADHIRLTYRNFFPPHLRWQFTGIRLAAYL